MATYTPKTSEIEREWLEDVGPRMVGVVAALCWGGGYLIGGSVAFASAALFPGVLWATAVSLGVGLMLMTLLRVTHPPAGAMPLIAFHGEVDFLMLAEGIALGGSALVIIALIWHRIPPRQAYPSGPRDYAGAIHREGLEDPGGCGS